MIRNLYRGDFRPKSIQDMLDLAADLVQELIDLRAEQDEWEWAVRWAVTEGEPVTDIGADEEDVRDLVIDQEGYAEAVRRRVSPWESVTPKEEQ